MTTEELANLREELSRLETDGRRAMAARIKTAREWGDLKENAEYHDAKNSLALLERRITVLREKLDNAVVVDAAPADGDVVAFGSKVEVVDETSGRTSEYTLVGSTEADLSAGLLSAESPVARALFGAREGDVIAVPAPRGERQLRVTRVGAR